MSLAVILGYIVKRNMQVTAKKPSTEGFFAVALFVCTVIFI